MRCKPHFSDRLHYSLYRYELFFGEFVLIFNEVSILLPLHLFVTTTVTAAIKGLMYQSACALAVPAYIVSVPVLFPNCLFTGFFQQQKIRYFTIGFFV